MELTTKSIYEDYKELVSGRYYWLIFLIMSTIFIFMGVAAGSLAMGIFMSAAMGIFMIGSTFSTNRALKRLKNGDFVIYFDMLTYKHISRSYKRQTTKFLVQSEKLFKSKKDVLSTLYDRVEVGHPFAAVYAGKKLIMFYDMTTCSLSPELYGKVKQL